MTTGPGPSPQQQPGWYPDPWRLAEQRWWDGRAWTPQTHPPTGPPPAPTPAPTPPAPPTVTGFEKPAPPEAGTPAAQPGSPAAPAPVAPPAPPAPAPGGYGSPAYGPGPTPPGYGPPAYGPGGAPGPGYPSPPAARPRVPGAAQAVAYVGAGLVLIGAFLPWATLSTGFLGSIDKTGTDGDGAITLVMSIAIAVLVAVAASGRGVRANLGIGIGLSVVCGLIAVIDIADVNGIVDDVGGTELGFEVKVGVGLWVTLLGSVVAAVGTVLGLVGRTTPSPAPGW